MLKRPHYIALGLVVLLTLVILNLPDRMTARLKLGLGGLFLPLFGLAGSSHQLAGQAGDALVPRNELLRQNEALRREKEQLRLQSIQTEEMARENARLRQLFGWQQQQRWKLKLANVVLREPANWWRTVQIDLGTRNGLSNNLPVLASDGFLVGRISSVSLTRAQVVLLGDPSLKIAARVENETRDTGIIGCFRAAGERTRDDGLPFQERQLEAGPRCGHQRQWRSLPKGHPDRESHRFALGRLRSAHRSACETGGEPGCAGGSMGAVPMNWLNAAFILGAAFLAVFWEAAFHGVRHLFGAQIDLLPPLMVYASLSASLTTVALLAVLGGTLVRLSFGQPARRECPAAVPHWPGDLCETRIDSAGTNCCSIGSRAVRQRRSTAINVAGIADDRPHAAAGLGHVVAMDRHERRRRGCHPRLLCAVQLAASHADSQWRHRK